MPCHPYPYPYICSLLLLFCLAVSTTTADVSPGSQGCTGGGEIAWVATWNGYQERCCEHGALYRTYHPITHHAIIVHVPLIEFEFPALKLCVQMAETGIICALNEECITGVCLFERGVCA